MHFFFYIFISFPPRQYIKYRPNEIIKKNPSAWWKYAYNSILDYNVKPYTWKKIVEHRKNYRRYKEACLQSLLRPNDTELKLDLQKYEDCLTIFNIVIAREHARQELKNRMIKEKRQGVNNGGLSLNSMKSTTSLSQEEVENLEIKNKATQGQETKISSDDISNSSEKQIKIEKLLQPIGIISNPYII